MEIELHGYVVTIKRMRIEDIINLTTNHLHTDYNLLTRNGYNGSVTLTYAFGNCKESVSIRCGSVDEDGYFNFVTVNLHGSFFDHSPGFAMEEFIEYISVYGFTNKQLDIAFTDNAKCMSITDIVRWCEERKEYCKGSLVRRTAPGIRYIEKQIDRIELSSATSKVNYGTIYVRPDTGYVRTEIKFKDKDKIDWLLDGYSSTDKSVFETKSLQALVGCIDFVTPSSSRKRSPDKYVRQRLWKKFLESDIQKINWAEVKSQNEANRSEADDNKCNSKIKRMASMLQNMLSRLTPIMPEDEILERFNDICGYTITKRQDAYSPLS